MEMINAIGRRKRSIARVYLTKGTGKISVNGKDFKEYFPQLHIQPTVTDPFATVEIDTNLFVDGETTVGELTIRHFDDRFVIDHFGRHRTVSTLTPDDFEQMMTRLHALAALRETAHEPVP